MYKCFLRFIKMQSNTTHARSKYIFFVFFQLNSCFGQLTCYLLSIANEDITRSMEILLYQILIT